MSAWISYKLAIILTIAWIIYRQVFGEAVNNFLWANIRIARSQKDVVTARTYLAVLWILIVFFALSVLYILVSLIHYIINY